MEVAGSPLGAGPVAPISQLSTPLFFSGIFLSDTIPDTTYSFLPASSQNAHILFIQRSSGLFKASS